VLASPVDASQADSSSIAAAPSARARSIFIASPRGQRSSAWRHVRVDAGGATLGPHAVPESIAGGIAIDDPPRARAETPIKLAFHADDPEAEHARLTALGVPMREMRRFGALVRCDGVDPEGNVFQITNA
jgi:hypothetical protein